MSDDLNEEAGVPPVGLTMQTRGTGDNQPVPRQIARDAEMVVREIGVTLAGGELSFEYIRAWYPRAVTRADFERYVSEFGKGNVPPGFTEKPMYLDLPNPPHPVKLSKLSIRNRKDRYLVFMLARGINWQFAQTGPAITVARGLEHTAYFEGWRVNGQGQRMHLGQDRLDDCRVAYIFAYDGSANGTHEFAFPFNLNVDLYHDVGAANETLTPIVIDPDTRYPGGNTIVGDAP